MRKFRFFVLLTIAIYSSLGAQDIRSDTLLANELFSTAQGFIQAGLLDSAMSNYERSGSLYQAAGNSQKYFQSRLQIASILRRLRRLDDAIAYSQSLLTEVREEMGPGSMRESSVLEVMGNAYNLKSAYNKALECHLAVLDIRERHAEVLTEPVANAYSNLAATYFRLGDYRQAVETFELVLQQRLQLYEEDHFLIAHAYHNLGYVYHLTSDEHTKALNYYEKSRVIFERIYSADNYNLGNVNNGMSQVLRVLGRWDDALTHANKAMEIGLKNFGENHYLVANALTNQSGVLLQQGEYERALFVNQRILKINHAQYGEKHLYTADAYLGLAEVYDSLRDHHATLKSLQQAQRIFESLYEAESPEKAKVYLALARHFFTLGKPDSALAYTDKGLRANVVGWTPDMPLDRGLHEKAISQKRLLQILHLRARIQYQIGNRDGDVAWWQAALTSIQWGDQLLRQMRTAPMLQEDYLYLSQVTHGIYQDAMKTCDALWARTREKRYESMAFDFSRKSKSSLLKTSLMGQKAKRFVGIPDSLLQHEQKLLVDKSFLRTRLLDLTRANTRDTSELHQVKEELFNIQRVEQLLMQRLEENYPAYFEIKYDASPLTIEQLQQQLRPTETLVEYFIAEEKVKAFMVSRSAFHTVDLQVSDDLMQAIAALDQLLAASDFEGYSQLAYELYRQLVEPLPLTTSEVIIIPDGPLHFLNFDVLLTALPEKADFRYCDYLIRNLSIRYHYSADLLVTPREYPYHPKVLAFSFGTGDTPENGSIAQFRNVATGDIPGARGEIVAISQLLEGDYYLGSYASERQFKNVARDYAILHLALHGIVDHADPMNSRISFYPAADTLEDNQLHAFELYHTELHADLVVLSACDTGIGQLRQGEGIVNLAKSFSFAGSNSLIFSLWELSDLVAPQIMVPFYQFLVAGDSKSKALRKAKLAYLQQADNLTANPYYWAPLVFYGGDNAMKAPAVGSFASYGVGLLFVILLGVFLVRKRLSTSESDKTIAV